MMNVASGHFNANVQEGVGERNLGGASVPDTSPNDVPIGV
jgi:hypothetical protein